MFNKYLHPDVIIKFCIQMLLFVSILHTVYMVFDCKGWTATTQNIFKHTHTRNVFANTLNTFITTESYTREYRAARVFPLAPRQVPP